MVQQTLEKGPWTTVESMTRSSRIQGNLEAELLASAGEFGTGAASSKSGSEISNVKPSLNAKQPIMALVIRPWAISSQILALLPTPAHRCNHTRITDGTRTNGLARRQSQLARRTQSFVGRREGLLGETRSHGRPEEFARVAVGRLFPSVRRDAAGLYIAWAVVNCMHLTHKKKQVKSHRPS